MEEVGTAVVGWEGMPAAAAEVEAMVGDCPAAATEVEAMVGDCPAAATEVEVEGVEAHLAVVGLAAAVVATSTHRTLPSPAPCPESDSNPHRSFGWRR